MGLVSVLTAAHKPNRGFLREAAASLKDQELPPEWAVEWVVQEDGAHPAGLSGYPGVELSYAAHRSHMGPALSRNLALARARGQLVAVLDCDDVMLPHALAAAIEVFEAHPQVQWFAGTAEDLLPDGQRKTVAPTLAHGLVPAGAASVHLTDDPPVIPAHPAGLIARADAVRALGGWAGFPSSEDTLLFAALTTMFDGYFHDEPTWLYRIHPEQTTRSDGWYRHNDAAWAAIRQRVAAARAVREAFFQQART